MTAFSRQTRAGLPGCPIHPPQFETSGRISLEPSPIALGIAARIAPLYAGLARFPKAR